MMTSVISDIGKFKLLKLIKTNSSHFIFLLIITLIVEVNFNDFVIFIYLGFYVAFNTIQVISRRVVGRAEETST